MGIESYWICTQIIHSFAGNAGIVDKTLERVLCSPLTGPKRFHKQTNNNFTVTNLKDVNNPEILLKLWQIQQLKIRIVGKK